MPRLDGSGPKGEGAMTGRGRGGCAVIDKPLCYGRGGGLRLNKERFQAQDSLESLELEEKILENRLRMVQAKKKDLV